MDTLKLGYYFLRKIRTPLFCEVPLTSLLFDKFHRTLMALAEALSEPGRRFSPDQVMLNGHELNPGQYGTLSASPKRNLSWSIFSLCVLCSSVRPLFMNGQVEFVHS